MPELSIDEFSALLARAHRGDNRAVTDLVGHYEGIVRRAAHGMLGPAMRAQVDSMDVVQSVHRSLLIGLRQDKFDISSPEKLIALALTLVRRKIARKWRVMQRQPPVRPNSSLSGSGSWVLDNLPGRPADPAEAVQIDEELRQFLDELDAVDRQLMELRLEGHSTAEVARRMGVDSRFLRVRLGRLRKRLRDRGYLHEWV